MDAMQVAERELALPVAPLVIEIADAVINARWIAAWLDGRNARTFETYGRGMRLFLLFARGVRLDRVDNSQVLAFDAMLRAQREGGQISANTHRLRLNCVRAFWSFACETWPFIFKVNPARKLTLPAVRRHLGGKVVAEDGVLAMVASEPDPLRRIVVRALYSSGMRVSELCGLTCGDVSEVEDAQGRPAARLNVWGKGEHEREAGVSAATWAELKPRWDGRPADAPLFSRDGVTPLNRHQVARMVARAGKVGGVDHATPHRMRHSHITHAIKHGADRAIVRHQVGHSSEAVTGWYTDLAGGETSADYLRI